MEDINVVIAGAAGEGVQTIGEILGNTISAQGYAVFSWQEFESRIRGGQVPHVRHKACNSIAVAQDQ